MLFYRIDVSMFVVKNTVQTSRVFVVYNCVTALTSVVISWKAGSNKLFCLGVFIHLYLEIVSPGINKCPLSVQLKQQQHAMTAACSTQRVALWALVCKCPRLCVVSCWLISRSPESVLVPGRPAQRHQSTCRIDTIGWADCRRWINAHQHNTGFLPQCDSAICNSHNIE